MTILIPQHICKDWYNSPTQTRHLLCQVLGLTFWQFSWHHMWPRTRPEQWYHSQPDRSMGTLRVHFSSQKFVDVLRSRALSLQLPTAHTVLWPSFCIKISLVFQTQVQNLYEIDPVDGWYRCLYDVYHEKNYKTLQPCVPGWSWILTLECIIQFSSKVFLMFVLI